MNSSRSDWPSPSRSSVPSMVRDPKCASSHQSARLSPSLSKGSMGCAPSTEAFQVEGLNRLELLGQWAFQPTAIRSRWATSNLTGRPSQPPSALSSIQNSACQVVPSELRVASNPSGSDSVKHPAPVWRAIFEETGERESILTLTWGGLARRWDARTGMPLSDPEILVPLRRRPTRRQVMTPFGTAFSLVDGVDPTITPIAGRGPKFAPSCPRSILREG